MLQRDLIIGKLRDLDERVRFLEYAWSQMSQFDRDKSINNYEGFVPRQYKR